MRLVDASIATLATTQSLDAWQRASPLETDDSDAASRTLVCSRCRSTSGQLSGSCPSFKTSAPELRSYSLLSSRPPIVRYARVARRSISPAGAQSSVDTSRTTGCRRPARPGFEAPGARHPRHEPCGPPPRADWIQWSIAARVTRLTGAPALYPPPRARVRWDGRHGPGACR